MQERLKIYGEKADTIPYDDKRPILADPYRTIAESA